MSEKMKRIDEKGVEWFKSETVKGRDVWRQSANQFVMKVVPAGSWDPAQA